MLLDREIGSIVLWQGAIVDIPEFWALCNGLNGTPDLRDQMVVGSNGTYAPDQTGGATPHQHDFTSDGHTHTVPAGDALGAGSGFSDTTNSKTFSGTTDNKANLPPYYSLAFIMFMGE